MKIAARALGHATVRCCQFDKRPLLRCCHLRDGCCFEKRRKQKCPPKTQKSTRSLEINRWKRVKMLGKEERKRKERKQKTFFSTVPWHQNSHRFSKARLVWGFLSFFLLFFFTSNEWQLTAKVQCVCVLHLRAWLWVRFYVFYCTLGWANRSQSAGKLPVALWRWSLGSKSCLIIKI